MKTRCPACGTIYDVDPKLLEEARGLARCFNCDEIFDGYRYALHTAQQEQQNCPTNTPAASTPADTPSDGARLDTAGARLDTAPESSPKSAPLPFEMPEQMSELTPSENVALKVSDTLYPSTQPATPRWQKALVGLLALTLAAQTLWLRRDLWANLPQTSQLCAWLQCVPPRQPRPDLYHVVERAMVAVPERPGALRFELSFRNDADHPQPLPRLQLELLDSNGTLVARRTFGPGEYLPPSWSGPQVALPHEVVQTRLTLADPGPRVRGFRITFL